MSIEVSSRLSEETQEQILWRALLCLAQRAEDGKLVISIDEIEEVTGQMYMSVVPGETLTITACEPGTFPTSDQTKH
jgi:hypothetical protein